MSDVVNWIVVEPGFTKAGLNPFRVRSEIAKGINEWAKTLKGLVEFREGYTQRGCIAFQMSYGVINANADPDRVAQCDDFKNNWVITFLPHGAPANKVRPKQKWLLGWWQDTFSLGDSILAATIHEVGHVFDFKHPDEQDPPVFDPQHPMHSQFPDCRNIGRRYRQSLREEFIRRYP